jgi:hypothetical protein
LNRKISIRRIILVCLVVSVVVVLVITFTTPASKLVENLSTFVTNPHVQKAGSHTVPPTSPASALYHISGGFGIDTPSKAIDAASDGLKFTLFYGTPPTPTSPIGLQLQALHFKIIDGFISSTLYFYECHKSKTIPHPSPAIANYCQRDYYPSYTSDDAVLAVIKAHLQSVLSNPLIGGYWVLDDQASWDTPGYDKSILQKIHALIQQYTPNYPTICGFGADLGISNTSSWNPALALNFTPQGCDVVGLYVYSSSQSVSRPPVNTNTFDWSMSGLLPRIFSSLRAQGWNSAQEPFVGIPQAWAGQRKDIPSLYEPTPSAQNMLTQALSFCRQGAIGLIYYGWDDSSVNLFPWNTPAMKQGVQEGIAACNQYWS